MPALNLRSALVAWLAVALGALLVVVPAPGTAPTATASPSLQALASHPYSDPTWFPLRSPVGIGCARSGCGTSADHGYDAIDWLGHAGRPGLRGGRRRRARRRDLGRVQRLGRGRGRTLGVDRPRRRRRQPLPPPRLRRGAGGPAGHAGRPHRGHGPLGRRPALHRELPPLRGAARRCARPARRPRVAARLRCERSRPAPPGARLLELERPRPAPGPPADDAAAGRELPHGRLDDHQRQPRAAAGPVRRRRARGGGRPPGCPGVVGPAGGLAPEPRHAGDR